MTTTATELHFAAKVLGDAKCPEDVFGKDADADAVQSQFRQLARQIHPDHFHHDPVLLRDATAALGLLNMWHQQAVKKIDAGTYGTDAPVPADTDVLIRIPRDEIRLGALIRSGDIADVFAGHLVQQDQAVVVKVVRSAKDNDLIEREARTLKDLHTKVEAKGTRYFSSAPRALLDVGGRRGIVLKRHQQHVALDRIQKRAQLGLRDAAWMFRRMLEGLGYLHRAGYVHGAVLPQHLLFHPERHGLHLVDWTYAVPAGQKAVAISSPHAGFYPPEVTAKQPLTPATDIFMAAKCFLETQTEINSGHLAAFLSSCLLSNPARRPQDAWQVHEEFGQLLEKLIGPPKYHQLKLTEGESGT